MPWYFKWFVLGLVGLTYLSSLFANTLEPNTFGYAGQPTNANTHFLIVDGHRRYNPNHDQFLAQSNTTPFAGNFASNGYRTGGNPMSPTAIALLATGGTIMVTGGVATAAILCAKRARRQQSISTFIDQLRQDSAIQKTKQILQDHQDHIEPGYQDFANSYQKQNTLLFDTPYPRYAIDEGQGKNTLIKDITLEQEVDPGSEGFPYYQARLSNQEIRFSARLRTNGEFRGKVFRLALESAQNSNPDQSFYDKGSA